MWWVIIGIVLCTLGRMGVQARCPASALASFPLVLEYAVWRGWHQAIIYTPDLEHDCQWATVRLMKCLSVNGIAAAADVIDRVHVQIGVGIVILAPRLQRNASVALAKLITQLHSMDMNTASFDWFVVSRSIEDIHHINGIMNATSIRFDQNIVASFPNANYRPRLRLLQICDGNFLYKSATKPTNRRRNFLPRKQYYYNNCRHAHRYDQNCNKTEYERNYYRTSERFRNLTRNQTYKKQGGIYPLFQSGVLNYNFSRTFDMVNISKFFVTREFNKWVRANNVNRGIEGIHLIQYFKVRTNSTLYAFFLGDWDPDHSMSRVESPYPVEARNFQGEELVVGRCNSSGDGAAAGDDDGPSAPALLDDVLHFLTYRINASCSTRYYSKLGFRSYEGAWTGLLGALTERSVDIALEPVTVHAPRYQDMDFIFPIAETMCNIYIRHQETSTVRDIFLAPFSARLLACVLAVAVAASIVVVLISRATSNPNDSRPMEYTEAFVWTTGILCQQGGSWTPPAPAASVLLIVCLLFAVVTYNAYAAFITSVLSVRVASVDTVAAVLHSPNFKIGYIKNGADQAYLMSTKDSQLNAFYIRGYSDAENLVSSAEEGLARAARLDYAFFAGQRAARSTLKSLSQARGRCALRELAVPSTRAHLAFPLPLRSPYARPTLVSLLLLRSGGAMARLQAALVPGMPRCAPPPGFASARATDVRSALILLVIGLVTALLLGKFSRRLSRPCGAAPMFTHIGT
ncbi:uncharacterized protein LOC133534851 [Cydia pomonella]|uniref:uncharacterized protein LOC133534851 n=1 Tax=Cydia pomonella TaxID=82600 RepID=UPI002ADD8224|nr:uncharacterized protein LOC133534851 [Cydia pomonella]